MSVYRLDPIDRDDLSWQASTEKKPLWASAATPATARELMATSAAAPISGSIRAKRATPHHRGTISMMPDEYPYTSRHGKAQLARLPTRPRALHSA
jgi:hypothetical protein